MNLSSLCIATILALAVVASPFAYASSEPQLIEIHSTQEQFSLRGRGQYLLRPSIKATTWEEEIKILEREKFITIPPEGLKRRRSHNQMIFKFRFNNRSKNEDFYLWMRTSNIRNKVWVIGEQNQALSFTETSPVPPEASIPYATRDSLYIKIPARQASTVYFLTASNYKWEDSLYISTPKDFVKETLYDTVVIFIYIGTILSLLIFSLILFVIVKDKLYLTFFLYLIGMNFSFANMGINEVVFTSRYLEEFHSMLVAIMFFSNHFFSVSFLDSKQHAKRLHKVATAFATIFIAFLILDNTFRNELLARLTQGFAAISFLSWFLSVTLISAKRIKNGFLPALPFILSWFFLFSSLFLVILFERRDGFLADNPMTIGLTLQSWCFVFALVSRYRVLLQALLKNLRESNKTLESIVAERTKTVKAILSQIKQGIFTINSDKKIMDDYSKHLEAILETPQIAGSNYRDLIFENSNLSQEKTDLLDNVLDSSVGEHQLAFAANQHVLPTELLLNLNQKTKFLELDWQPLCDSEDRVESYMVALRDVTNQRALKKQAEEKRKQLEITSQLMAIKSKTFVSFTQKFKEILKENTELLEGKQKFEDSLNPILQNLHTLKGISRMHGLSFLSEAIHKTEGDLKPNSNSHLSNKQRSIILRKDHAKLLAILDDYQKVFKEFFNNRKLEEKSTGYLSLLKILKKQRIESLNMKQIKSILKMIQEEQRQSLRRILDPYIQEISHLAQELKKEPPKVHIDEAYDFDFSPKGKNILENIFIHLFRNSLDHGLESAAEREKNNKNPRGNIHIKAKINKDKANFIVYDDGQGLDLSQLKKRAVDIWGEDENNLSPEKIASVIFESGVSTKEKSTDISGRGVGMDAVKSFLQKSGGDINIILASQNAKGNYNFKLAIEIPLSYISEKQ